MKNIADEGGSALGKIRGVYGVSNPALVVDYGSFNFPTERWEDIKSTAYFDLQSGQLKQVIKFN